MTKKDALKFKIGFLVKSYGVDLVRIDPARSEAIKDGMNRKVDIVLFPGKALLHCGCNDLPVSRDASGCVMIEAGYAQDIHALANLHPVRVLLPFFA